MSFLSDFTILWKLFLSLTILEFVLGKLGKGVLSYAIAGYLVYILVFENFIWGSTLYLTWFLLVMGVLWLVPDFLFMGPMKKFWHKVL